MTGGQPATVAKMLITSTTKRLREIDRRVRYLTKCLENLKIVDYSPQQEGKVFSARGLKSKR